MDTGRLDVISSSANPVECKSSIQHHLLSFRPAWIVTYADVPWISYMADPDMSGLRQSLGVKWIIYYPVDGATAVNRLPDPWASAISRADVAVTMSKFGVSVSRNSGLRAALIPHGVDTDLFKPPENKQAAKAALGYEGKFVILQDARNHRRKQLPRALDIIRSLSIPRKRLIFHLHTNPVVSEDLAEYRYSIQSDIEEMGLSEVSKGYGSSSCLDRFHMAQLYSAADIHLLTSYGEGFGLPTLQAASAGVVPIAPSNSASREMVAQHGFPVECDSACLDEFGIVRCFMDRVEAKRIIELLFANPGLLSSRSKESREFALKYEWSRIMRLWNELFDASLTTAVPGAVCANERPAVSAAYVSQAEAGEGLPKRPSGHSLSVLPIPRLTVPVRLSGVACDTESNRPLVLMGEPSCASQLAPLERLFPGLVVAAYAECSRSPLDLAELLRNVILVIDPDSRLPREIQRACAERGIGFLGLGDASGQSGSRDLLLQARRLLTDFAYAECRLRLARRSHMRLDA
jgi:glycosyltransferase involved in cell wall biosynthesis